MYLRVLDDGARPPAENMAIDEALLRGGGLPSLRLYGWQPHAVSLGYFQKVDDFADLPIDTVIVRRSTGGGAIHHGDEMTFALTLDADLLPKDLDQSYVLLHDAVRAALSDLGVHCTRQTTGAACGARPDVRWCFATAGRHDLVDAHGRKLVGSAQRRLRNEHARVLHHGSIVLQKPALTPFVAAIADQIEVHANRTKLRGQMVLRIAAALNLTPQPGTLSDQEHATATHLIAARFGDPSFRNAR